MMEIETLIIPTPFPVGPINIYLVRAEPLTLIDTGPKTPEALAALRAQLSAWRLQVKDIRRVILTHTHEDHCGLAGTIQQEAGAEVFVHEWEHQQLVEHRSTRIHPELVARTGIPAEILRELEAQYAHVHQFADAVPTAHAYQDGAEFAFAHSTLQAIHTPGHTPGSSCLWRASERLLIAGDTILKNTTPAPVLNADPILPTRRFAALGEYLVSLARLRALSPTLVKTAHGAAITDYEEYFFGVTRHLQEQQQALIRALPTTGATGWAMRERIFPHVQGLRRLLALSQVMAQLDLAVTEERIRLERGTSADVFFPVGVGSGQLR